MYVVNGFYITTCEDNGVERFNEKTGETEICEGFYCQVYADKDCDYEVDNFCLGVGYEIANTSEEEVERACREYVLGELKNYERAIVESEVA